MVQAMKSVKEMNLAQKEKIADEIFHAQPHMLGSVLVLQKLGHKC